jgi:hypothetical protein
LASGRVNIGLSNNMIFRGKQSIDIYVQKQTPQIKKLGDIWIPEDIDINKVHFGNKMKNSPINRDIWISIAGEEISFNVEDIFKFIQVDGTKLSVKYPSNTINIEEPREKIKIYENKYASTYVYLTALRYFIGGGFKFKKAYYYTGTRWQQFSQEDFYLYTNYWGGRRVGAVNPNLELEGYVNLPDNINAIALDHNGNLLVGFNKTLRKYKVNKTFDESKNVVTVTFEMLWDKTFEISRNISSNAVASTLEYIAVLGENSSEGYTAFILDKDTGEELIRYNPGSLYLNYMTLDSKEDMMYGIQSEVLSGSSYSFIRGYKIDLINKKIIFNNKFRLTRGESGSAYASDFVVWGDKIATVGDSGSSAAGMTSDVRGYLKDGTRLWKANLREGHRISKGVIDKSGYLYVSPMTRYNGSGVDDGISGGNPEKKLNIFKINVSTGSVVRTKQIPTPNISRPDVGRNITITPDGFLYLIIGSIVFKLDSNLNLISQQSGISANRLISEPGQYSLYPDKW